MVFMIMIMMVVGSRLSHLSIWMIASLWYLMIFDDDLMVFDDGIYDYNDHDDGEIETVAFITHTHRKKRKEDK